MAGLNAKKALIFRITHIDNVPWILDHGLHCQSSDVKDPSFIGIGMVDLISLRQHREVAIGPGGKLSDYVPFYFTPYSIMLYNIKTGYNNVIKRPNKDIVILVSSIHRLVELELRFVFFDGHAYLEESEPYNSVDDLDEIDWPLLRSKDFRKDPEDPGKLGRYQAEALAFRHVPVEALLGITCYNRASESMITDQVNQRGLDLPVKTLPGWYF